MINLDVRTLLQDDAIQEVEMEDAVDEQPSSNDNNDAKNNDDNVEGQEQRGEKGINDGEEDEDDNNDEGFRKVIRSKWDGDVSETNLGKQHSNLPRCFVVRCHPHVLIFVQRECKYLVCYMNFLSICISDSVCHTCRGVLWR